MTSWTIATVLVPFVLWLPGALVWVLVHGRRVHGESARVAFRASAWVYGLALLFVHYLVQEVVLDGLLGIRTGDGVALGLHLVAIVALVGLTVVTGRGAVLRARVVDARTAIVPYVAFAVLCAMLAAQGVTHPLRRLGWQHVARETFGVQVTHDNYFQFVNGKAIAEHVPFATFYGGGALVYPVTSRGILPGVLYSSWRRVVGGVRSTWADRFAWYLLFGIALNAMVVFPLDALRLRLGLALSPWLLLGLLASSSLFLVNGYYTWFKLCGAAFFLSGVAAVLAPPSTASWAAAGALWGLAASMHQGSAIGLPVVATWALARARRGLCARAGLFVAMTSAFVAVVLPWQIVMALCFPPDVLLLAGHYLDGHFAPTLAESARAFAASTSWQAQASHRLASLAAALRLRESGEVLAGWTWLPIEAWWASVPRARFGYAAVVLYPVALGALAARLVGRTPGPARDATGLLAASLLGLVLAILLHCSWWYADWVPHLPLGPLVLSYVLLADRCVRWRWTHVALVGLIAIEGALTLGALTSGVGQEALPLHCAKDGICGNALMLHGPDTFYLWTP